MNNLELRRTLLRRQNELNQRLTAVETDLSQAHHPDWSEQAQERENDEVLEALATQTAFELVQIDRVLQRLGEDHYGICQNCGKPIGTERLRALPEAVTCIDCAREALLSAS